MGNNELPVYKAVWELMLQMEHYIINFPKEYKMTHGQTLRKLSTDLVTCICLANASYHNIPKRIEYLEQAIGLYESYKFTKRLICEMHCISLKQSCIIDMHLAQIGKQLVGWKSSEEGKLKTIN